ncbi:hypothetical protein IX307_002910 [Bacteroides pyogenes]|uniref:YjbH domain-containing protein n=3 Tax=Bacteroides pyogenes TaxID=310300 RepID=A0A5D3EWN0_9BACE|nr:hypothetical protein [Bacteroides pyogenes]GAE16688.1 hypothetical protein JCM6292_3163 [Bacteroides pyogenes JCM 6292]MBR8704423.1 hypothetical protein [Bacteroides pyogenes]MBR8708655.1 hypothetical protein [Bacteroides pyogenes]MBR8716959.1 hypothetical protein [Bacteroides pyogenes]MBR8721645.1 hypothetical protein [Bacteroides pyogenes]
MKYLKIVVLSVIGMFCSSTFVSAQQSTSYNPLDFSFQIKNMHLWRGYQITTSAMGAVDIHLTDKSQCFTFGLWGGGSFNSDFKEFDYYASFQYGGFGIAVWDIYNFSPGATYNNRQVFKYSARETGHFIDVALSYQFQQKFPLKITWATVVFGRDRGVMNEKNLYSTYVSLDYPVVRNKIVDVDLGIAGAFALDKESGSDANFYADNPGIVNVNMTVSKKLKFGNYVLPVSAMAMWNPARNEANIQVAFNLF